MAKVRNINGIVVFATPIAGDANAWAKRNVSEHKNLFVDYYDDGNVIGHWFLQDTESIYGTYTEIEFEFC